MRLQSIDLAKFPLLVLMMWLGATARVDWWIITLILLYSVEIPVKLK